MVESSAFISNTELIMFYNVENLFVFDQKPLRRHIPPASGLRNWNAWRYADKIQKLGSVFEMVEKSMGTLPMLIGVSEVQGRQPLQDLAALTPLGGKYDIVHYESMDERGVDVALLYDKTKLELTASEPISFIFEISDDNPENYDTTRDILHCKFRYSGLLLHIFVLHLPSKREKDINRPKRDYMMHELRAKILDMISDKDASIILLGDFNENPDDVNLQKLLSDDNAERIMVNPFYDLYKNKIFSTFHRDEGLLFDQMILSRQFLNADHPLRFVSSEVFRPAELCSRDRRFAGRPYRTYAGSRYLGGYSDHFPVITKFQTNF